VSSDDEDDITEDEIREALRAIHAGKPRLSHVLCLAAVSDEYTTSLMPEEVIDAISAKYAMDGDVANGGLDQLAWNQGVEFARELARSFRAVGAIENADVLDMLAKALEEYETKNSPEAISKEPVRHFLAYRKKVGGPEFGIPEHGNELAEVLIEWVLDHAGRIPAADAKLVRK
jgi:hypothetical protein